jgi:hypothetical protein
MVMKMFEANKRRIVLIAFCLKFIAGRIQKKYFQNNRRRLEAFLSPAKRP